MTKQACINSNIPLALWCVASMVWTAVFLQWIEDDYE
jgi:hypothetical protein